MNELIPQKEFLLNGPLSALQRAAQKKRDDAFGDRMTYSRKVFIPLTQLCRDVCHYCTFAKTPAKLPKPFLTPEDVLAIARRGAAAGCKEALFTLGERPELRYAIAREALAELGYETTLEYAVAMARRVTQETGLLVHLNAGTLDATELQTSRDAIVSMGIMLESGAERLCAPGMAHFGSPDKQPAARWATLEEAGRQSVATTTGLLIGIGETRAERLADLENIAALHRRRRHIQEVIIQNFVPKDDTLMKDCAPPSQDELAWTIAAARLVLPAEISIQSPPNLNAGRTRLLVDAGINDWGGVSPVTKDFVNPESPWPELTMLANETADAGKQLVERLCLYPDFIEEKAKWLAPDQSAAVLRQCDSEGLAREESWFAGASEQGARPTAVRGKDRRVCHALDEVLEVATPSPETIENLFAARNEDFEAVCEAADSLRRQISGDRVSYVINRNINYTNICVYRCAFCAFAKGKTAKALRGPAYIYDLDEIVRRAEEGWANGATEVCLQGGIHPQYTGKTYLDIVGAIRAALPDIHIHAFSPLEIYQGAKTLGWSVRRLLGELQAAGLGSLPGTAAEILDDDVRKTLCPDKVTTAQWLDIVGAAHELGLKSTSTIMFGHMEMPKAWAKHLLALLKLQRRTGGISEFVPLPFVHMQSPIYLKKAARRGPTLREAILMHAVARLVFKSEISNIQVSWVKMGIEGSVQCLKAGANDLGGVLMNETISRSAGASHGSQLGVDQIHEIASRVGREAWQRTTLYAPIENVHESAHVSQTIGA